MAEKRGNGGYGMETYNPENGQYVSMYAEQQDASSLLGVNVVTNSIQDILPNKEGKRIFATQLSSKEFEAQTKHLYLEFQEVLQQELRNYYETKGSSSSIDTPERNKLREDIVITEMAVQERKPKKYEKKVYFVLGSPASGKSTIQTPLIENNGAYEIDADIFKNYLPEFKEDAGNSCYVHKESLDISERFMDNITRKGGNLIISKVGGYGSFKGIKQMIDKFMDVGYEVNLCYNDVPVLKCMERNINRYKQSISEGKQGRLILPTIFKTADNYIAKTFDKLTKIKGINSYAVYSNDVEYGQKPELIYKSNKWTEEM